METIEEASNETASALCAACGFEMRTHSEHDGSPVCPHFPTSPPLCPHCDMPVHDHISSDGSLPLCPGKEEESRTRSSLVRRRKMRRASPPDFDPDPKLGYTSKEGFKEFSQFTRSLLDNMRRMRVESTGGIPRTPSLRLSVPAAGRYHGLDIRGMPSEPTVVPMPVDSGLNLVNLPIESDVASMNHITKSPRKRAFDHSHPHSHQGDSDAASEREGLSQDDIHVLRQLDPIAELKDRPWSPSTTKRRRTDNPLYRLDGTPYDRGATPPPPSMRYTGEEEDDEGWETREGPKVLTIEQYLREAPRIARALPKAIQRASRPHRAKPPVRLLPSALVPPPTKSALKNTGTRAAPADTTTVPSQSPTQNQPSVTPRTKGSSWRQATTFVENIGHLQRHMNVAIAGMHQMVYERGQQGDADEMDTSEHDVGQLDQDELVVDSPTMPVADTFARMLNIPTPNPSESDLFSDMTTGSTDHDAAAAAIKPWHYIKSVLDAAREPLFVYFKTTAEHLRVAKEEAEAAGLKAGLVRPDMDMWMVVGNNQATLRQFLMREETSKRVELGTFLTRIGCLDRWGASVEAIEEEIKKGNKDKDRLPELPAQVMPPGRVIPYGFVVWYAMSLLE